jgi:hypothetical protein
MDSEVTQESIVAAAGELDREEFTRAELAEELEVRERDLKDALRAARRAGRLKKVGRNDDGKAVFRLTGM